MPTAGTLLLFAAAALALLLVPGPAVLYIVTRSATQGRRAGLVSVLGVHTGSIVHVVAAATGLSALLLASATAFEAVKLAGAAYLVLIGIARIVGRVESPAASTSPAPLRRVYGQGVVVAVLNPKTALFFVAFLPQFAHPDRGPVALQILVLGLCFMALGMVSDSAYALAAGTIAPRIRRRGARARRRGQRASGAVFLALGLLAAAAHRPEPA